MSHVGSKAIQILCDFRIFISNGILQICEFFEFGISQNWSKLHQINICEVVLSSLIRCHRLKIIVFFKVSLRLLTFSKLCPVIPPVRSFICRHIAPCCWRNLVNVAIILTQGDLLQTCSRCSCASRSAASFIWKLAFTLRTTSSLS